MAEIVERVAKAIGDEARRRHGGTLMAWASSPERTDCLAFARAAIEAMREPTAEMETAGNAALSANGLDSVEGDDSTSGWQAMIDAALE